MKLSLNGQCIWIILLCFFIPVFKGVAQNEKDKEPEHIDVLYLKDGSIFKGKILSYKINEEVVIQALGGLELKFAYDKVLKVEQQIMEKKEEPKPVPVRSAPEKEVVYVSRSGKRDREKETPKNDIKFPGMYYSADFSLFLPDFTSPDDFLDGFPDFSLSLAGGYHFTHYLGIGIGTGLYKYTFTTEDAWSFDRRSLALLPVFGEVSGNFFNKRITPYYRIRVGTTFPYSRSSSDIFDIKGKLIFNPSLGVRLGGRKSVNPYLSLGLVYSGVSYNRSVTDWSTGGVSTIFYERDVKAITFTFGLIF